MPWVFLPPHKSFAFPFSRYRGLACSGIGVVGTLPAGSYSALRRPLNGLKSLDAETARPLAANAKGSLQLNGLARLDAETAKALAANKKWDGQLHRVTALDSPASWAIAKALATGQGPLALPSLEKISPKTLAALFEKEDVEVPLIETLELITKSTPIPDFLQCGSWCRMPRTCDSPSPSRTTAVEDEATRRVRGGRPELHGSGGRRWLEPAWSVTCPGS